MFNQESKYHEMAKKLTEKAAEIVKIISFSILDRASVVGYYNGDKYEVAMLTPLMEALEEYIWVLERLREDLAMINARYPDMEEAFNMDIEAEEDDKFIKNQLQYWDKSITTFKLG
jgi:hypothetical protein